MKKYKLFFPLFIFILFVQCNSKVEQLIKLSGEAQGTTYHITYYGVQGEDISFEIDSILRRVDSSVSTYVPFSIISSVKGVMCFNMKSLAES